MRKYRKNQEIELVLDVNNIIHLAKLCRQVEKKKKRKKDKWI